MQINKHNAKSAAARSERGLHFFSSCKGILSDKSHYHGGSVYEGSSHEGPFYRGSSHGGFPFFGRRPLFTILAVMAAAIGICVFIIPYSLTDYEPYRGKRVTLTGTVYGLEQKIEGDTLVWRMMLSDIQTDDTAADTLTDSAPGSVTDINADSSIDSITDINSDSAAGGFINPGKRDRVLCILDHAPEADMSARVRLCGTMYPFRRAMNEGEFDLLLYYHILRVSFSLRDVDTLAASAPTDQLAVSLFHLKNYISEQIDCLFSTQNSAVLKAMLLGEKGLLEEETRELYQGAGIVHILSISGLHLSLLGMGLFSLTGKCRWIPMPVRAAASILIVFLYGKMIGMGTSVFRALVMLTLYIISKVIGRTYDILTAASIAAFLLLLDQPLYLLHTGFQFSFCAVLAIGILLPALPGRILKAIAIPLATLPVYLWAYGTFPVTSLLLNLIVIPLMTVVMVSAGGAVLLAGLAGCLFSGMTDLLSANRVLPANRALSANGAMPSALQVLPRILGLPAELILDFYRFLAESSGKIPGHEIVLGRPSPIRILVFYSMLLILAAISVRLQMPHMRRRIEADAVLQKQEASLLRLRNAQTENAAYAAHVTENPGAKVWSEVFADSLESCRRKEDRGDLLLRRAVAKTCQIFHLYDNRSRKDFACICTALWIAAALSVLAFRFSPAFEMDMLYVGQGDGIFISCQGRHFLIDGGSSTKEDLAKYTLLPFLHSKGVGHLDGIILTHDDIDHCSGLLQFLEAAAEEKPLISLSAVYLPDIAESAKGENYKRIENLCGQVGIPVRCISRGQRLRSGCLTMECLHPVRGASYEDANEYSTTLLLRYRDSSLSQEEDSAVKPDLSGKAEDFSALLTGDLEGQGEEELLKYLTETNLLQASEELPNIDVLKVAHHGSKNATSEHFLQLVHPDIAIISAGIDNMYGHPAEELLDRLVSSASRSAIYRTDLQGEISIGCRKKGDDYQIKTFLGDMAETSETSKRRSQGNQATDAFQG